MLGGGEIVGQGGRSPRGWAGQAPAWLKDHEVALLSLPGTAQQCKTPPPPFSPLPCPDNSPASPSSLSHFSHRCFPQEKPCMFNPNLLSASGRIWTNTGSILTQMVPQVLSIREILSGKEQSGCRVVYSVGRDQDQGQEGPLGGCHGGPGEMAWLWGSSGDSNSHWL